MVLEATIEAAIYIVVVFLCLSDCFRAVVKETQVDSILDWWSMSATWSMHLVLTHRLSACVYITLCYYISMYYLPYFPSKKVYIFICEWGVSAYGKNRITLWVFETNKPHYLHRRNHWNEMGNLRHICKLPIFFIIVVAFGRATYSSGASHSSFFAVAHICLCYLLIG